VTDLFDFDFSSLRAVEPAEGESIEERFQRFHEENPVIYRLFCRFVDELVHAGRKRFSADAVLHRIRWETAIQTTDEKFKINDHYSSRYARLWLDENPGHGSFFELRKLRS